jgi:uncharacterized membrane protein
MQKRKAIFEEFIKNYLYKVENVLKVHLHLLILALVLPLLICLGINVGQFPVCALYCNNTQNKASTCHSVLSRKGCEWHFLQ